MILCLLLVHLGIANLFAIVAVLSCVGVAGAAYLVLCRIVLGDGLDLDPEPTVKSERDGTFSSDDECDLGHGRAKVWVLIFSAFMHPNKSRNWRIKVPRPEWMKLLDALGIAGVVVTPDFTVSESPGSQTIELLAWNKTARSDKEASDLARDSFEELCDRMPWMRRGVFCDVSSARMIGDVMMTVQYPRENSDKYFARIPGSVAEIGGEQVPELYQCTLQDGTKVCIGYIKFVGCPADKALSLKLAMIAAGQSARAR